MGPLAALAAQDDVISPRTRVAVVVTVGPVLRERLLTGELVATRAGAGPDDVDLAAGSEALEEGSARAQRARSIS